jgi:hypothetical protein
MNWKGFGRSGCSLIEVLTRNFPGRTEESLESLRDAGVPTYT